MNIESKLGSRPQPSDKRLLGYSGAILVLTTVFAVVIAPPVPGIWRKAGGYLGVIGLVGSPTFLLMGVWETLRFGRTRGKIFAILLSAVWAQNVITCLLPTCLLSHLSIPNFSGKFRYKHAEGRQRNFGELA